MSKLKIEDVPVSDLVPYANNARIHDSHQIDELVKSIKQFGFTNPVLIDASNNVIAGHGRIEAAKKAKLKTVPCIRLELTDVQRRAYAHLDNKLGELSQWDFKTLALDLDEIAKEFDSLIDLDDLFHLKDPIQYQVKRIPIENVKPHPRNYRVHPDDQLDHLCESICENGLYRNVIIAADGTILAGHGLVLACRRLGIRKIPVLQLDLDPMSPKALKLLAGDNEVTHLGDVDDRALSELLKEILEDDSLLGTGYDEKMLANLLFVTRPATEIKNKTAAEQWVGMPDYTEETEDIVLAISFDTEEDRLRFLDVAGIKTIHNKRFQKWATWWPERKTDDTASVKFK